MHTTLLALAGLIAAAPLVYTAPQKGDPAPDAYEITEFAAGEVVHVATDEVNVREAPKVAGKVLATLPIGTALTIDERSGGPVRVADRVGHWYRAHVTHPAEDRVAGFVFGPGLTPYCFQGDLDHDGTEDVATVAFNGDFKARVRFRGKGGVKALDVEPTGMAYLGRKGGQVTVQPVPAREAGIALLKLEFRIEACGDYKDTYVSFADGVPRLALEASGLSDPPAIADFKVAFDPAALTAVVHRRTAELDASGKEKDKERVADSYRLERGVYQKTGSHRE